ncbi:MAG: hypothetical protein ACI9T9_002329 [Oleiphilaceae bacterium]|jgi:hypothetical protein
MKCFIAVDEDLLLKLWMLDPQLVAPFSQADMPKKNGVQLANRSSQYQLRECHLTIEDEAQTQLTVPKNTGRLP